MTQVSKHYTVTTKRGRRRSRWHGTRLALTTIVRNVCSTIVVLAIATQSTAVLGQGDAGHPQGGANDTLGQWVFHTDEFVRPVLVDGTWLHLPCALDSEDDDCFEKVHVLRDKDVQRLMDETGETLKNRIESHLAQASVAVVTISVTGGSFIKAPTAGGLWGIGGRAVVIGVSFAAMLYSGNQAYKAGKALTELHRILNEERLFAVRCGQTRPLFLERLRAVGGKVYFPQEGFRLLALGAAKDRRRVENDLAGHARAFARAKRISLREATRTFYDTSCGQLPMIYGRARDQSLTPLTEPAGTEPDIPVHIADLGLQASAATALLSREVIRFEGFDQKRFKKTENLIETFLGDLRDDMLSLEDMSSSCVRQRVKAIVVRGPALTHPGEAPYQVEILPWESGATLYANVVWRGGRSPRYHLAFRPHWRDIVAELCPAS